jgi:hypothetical protein
MLLQENCVNFGYQRQMGGDVQFLYGVKCTVLAFALNI